LRHRFRGGRIFVEWLRHRALARMREYPSLHPIPATQTVRRTTYRVTGLPST
jgi:hypothetical protein